MKKIHRQALISTALLTLALQSGCASRQASKSSAIIGGSALGAVIGHNASDGDTAWTAGGAAVGALMAMGANALADEKERKAYRDGYEAALNQSAKQQYWIIQNRQKEDQFTGEGQSESFIPVKIPEQNIDGEITNERIIYVRAK